MSSAASAQLRAVALSPAVVCPLEEGVQCRRRKFLGHMAAVALAALAAPAFAQAGRTVRLLALQPGGPSDLLARALAPGFAEALGESVVVENRGGAGGSIAAQMALRGEPDGRTLLVGGANNMVMAPLLSRSADYDPYRDFAVVSPLATVPYALAASPHLGVSDLAGLVAAVRAAKQPLSAGSGGVGGSSHVAAELLFQRLAQPFLHVPYKGALLAMQEMVAGRIDLVATDLPVLLPLARDGKLRIVGVTGSQRSALAPDIRTLAEQGLTGFRIEPWYALFCRAEAARARVQALAAAVRRVGEDPAYLLQLQRIGFDLWNDSAQGVAALMKLERERGQALLDNGVLRRD